MLRFIGSSPLARGTPPLRRPRRSRPAVHPRSRGEHAPVHRLEALHHGSSPLARGTRELPGHRGGRHRFIPARAGNTGRFRRGARCTSVHPRSRGEHRTSGRAEPSTTGSSPLARGTRIPYCLVILVLRFIPARAGNTQRLRDAQAHLSVHPRSRGEHWRDNSFEDLGHGSSPLARGTPARSSAATCSARFIPARAGNTNSCPRGETGAPVHPRSRGEHSRRPSSNVSTHGSSPLARGTPGRRARRARDHRFIPARAGNTSPFATGDARSSVHPRSRGEHLLAHQMPAESHGSSPLARGTPRESHISPHFKRFIPARAGNTLPRTH